MESYVQQELFRKEPQVSFTPPSVMWNLWHGCTNYVVLHIIRVMRFYSYVEQV